jgi:glucose/mannose-6-phosphate isomerase
MLSFEKIMELDSANMFAVLKEFPEQLSKAMSIGIQSPSFSVKPSSNDFLVLGMGGSAIGGDLLKNFLAYSEIDNKIKINVCRDYDLPKFVDENTNIIASSYSGNTEETLTSVKNAIKITKRIICITTGGELKQFAIENKLPYIEIPSGLQPRAALGFSIIPMIYIILNSGILPETEVRKVQSSIENTIGVISKLSNDYIQINENNPAINIADRLIGKMPIIYSSDRYSATNQRWRGQINENAKSIAYGNLVPEMNHNEINSFDNPADIINKIAVILLLDKTDNHRTKIRFTAVKDILKDKIADIIEVNAISSDYFVNAMSFIYLGDWVSYYLSVLNGADPTPIPLIIKLKTILAGTK